MLDIATLPGTTIRRIQRLLKHKYTFKLSKEQNLHLLHLAENVHCIFGHPSITLSEVSIEGSPLLAKFWDKYLKYVVYQRNYINSCYGEHRYRYVKNLLSVAGEILTEYFYGTAERKVYKSDVKLTEMDVTFIHCLVRDWVELVISFKTE